MVRRWREERRHLAALPAEDRFQLPHSNVILRRPCRPGQAQLMCTFVYGCGVAGVAEHVAKGFLGQRLAGRAADEGDAAELDILTIVIAFQTA